MRLETAYIALGANLGNARATLEEAVCRIGQFDGVTVTKCSSFYKTAPIDSSGPDYINAVIEVKTVIDERELLRWLLELEKEFGRVRPVGVVNAPRTMGRPSSPHSYGSTPADSRKERHR